MGLVNVNISVNGKNYSHDVEPRLLLVHYLRDILRLTGTHIGCDTSSCGACNILLDGRSVKSCTILAVQASGSEITTIEGLFSNGKLHPIQEAFRDQHGLQCGFCTPGIIMSAVELLNHNSKPTETQIKESLEGNFCRCTGYHNIIKSIQQAAEQIK